MEELKEGWRRVKISEVCEIIFSGGTPNTKISEYWNGNINWLSSGETRHRYIKTTEKKITKNGVEKSSTKLALKNDVVVASAGQGFTRGQASYCLINTYINQSVISLRSNFKVIDSKYLFFNIISRYNELRHLSDGNASRGSLTTKIMKDLDIFLPPLETQEKIASILSALDDKIEINNEMNKTLEEMAQTLFKRWFIDFDFPNENGEPYRSSGGKMVESELGEIPEGWEVKELKSFGETITGKTPSTIKKEYFGKDIPFIKTPDMHGNIFICEYENYLSNLGAESQHKKYVPENTVLMSCIGAKAGVVSLTTEKSQFNQQINGFIATNSYDAFYFYFALNLQKDNLRLKGSSGSTMININKNSFETHKYFYGDKNTMQNISKLFKPIFEKIKQNMIENNILKNKRDTLLPKLMSGEVEV